MSLKPEASKCSRKLSQNENDVLVGLVHNLALSLVIFCSLGFGCVPLPLDASYS